jgi:hypothetical protein
MFFYLTAQHTTRIVRIVMQLQSTHTANGHGDSAVRFIRPHFVGETRIVAHPDRPNSFAILDAYGDYVCNFRGFVQPFTKQAAQAAIGKAA